MGKFVGRWVLEAREVPPLSGSAVVRFVQACSECALFSHNKPLPVTDCDMRFARAFCKGVSETRFQNALPSRTDILVGEHHPSFSDLKLNYQFIFLAPNFALLH